MHHSLCKSGDISSLQYFDENIPTDLCYELIENAVDCDYIDILFEKINKFFPDLNIDISIKKLYINSMRQNNTIIIKKIEPTITDKLEIIKMMTNNENFNENFYSYEKYIQKYIFNYYEYDLSIVVRDLMSSKVNYDICCDEIEKIGYNVLKYFYDNFTIRNLSLPVYDSSWIIHLYCRAFMLDRHNTCDILGKIIDEYQQFNLKNIKLLCPFYYKFYKNDIDDLNCSKKIIKQIFIYNGIVNSWFPYFKLTKQMYEKYIIKCISHAYPMHIF